MTLFLQSLQSLGRLLGDTANKRTFLRRPNWQFVVLATTVAFCLAVFCLDCHSLWLAEGVAYGRAHIPLHKIMAHIAGGDGHPPLYFWLMHGWLTLGTTEFWMRLPSVIFFTLTVPVVYVIGRTISTPRAGVYATFLFATAPFLMSWAQVARGYAMLTFFCSVALMSLALILYRYDARRPAFIGAGLREMCLGRAQHRETGWAPAIRDDLIWLAYILSVVAALLTHNTAVLLPVVTGLIFIVAIGFAPDFKWRHTLNFAVAHLFVALLYGWYLPYLLDGVARIKRSFYVKSVSVEQVKRAFYSVYGNEYIPLMLLAFFCLFIVALVAHYRTRQWRWMAFALIGWLGLPILQLIAGVLYRPIFVTKTLIWSCVPFLLMCAVGISLLRTRMLRGLVLAGLLLSNLYGVFAEYGNTREDWDSAVDTVVQRHRNRPPGSLHREDWDRVVDTVVQDTSGHDAVVICISWVIDPFNYYWRYHDQDSAAVFGIQDGKMRRFVFSARDDPTKWGALGRERRDVGTLFDDYERVWVVFSHANRCDKGAIRGALVANGRLIGEHQFRGIQLLRYDKK